MKALITGNTNLIPTKIIQLYSEEEKKGVSSLLLDHCCMLYSFFQIIFHNYYFHHWHRTIDSDIWQHYQLCLKKCANYPGNHFSSIFCSLFSLFFSILPISSLWGRITDIVKAEKLKSKTHKQSNVFCQKQYTF